MRSVGDCITTPRFGKGTIVDIRNDTYKIQLPFGVLYQPNPNLSTQIAYQSLESMRLAVTRAELECRGISGVNVNRCKFCLLEQHRNNNHNNKLWTPFVAWFDSPSCLICGTSVCSHHSSKQFHASDQTTSTGSSSSSTAATCHIHMCHECEGLLLTGHDLDAQTEETRRETLLQLVDLYDRVRIVLQFVSAQHLDHLSQSLQQSEIVSHTKSAVGGSGMMGGVLGVASILVAGSGVLGGSSLLLASVLFGGSATLTSQERWWASLQRPTDVADRIVALHTVLRHILRVIDTLQDSLKSESLKEQASKNTFLVPEVSNDSTSNKAPSPISLWTSVAAATTVASSMLRDASKLTEWSVLSSQTARLAGRSSTAALHTLSVAGGSLAAVTLFMEAQSFKTTLETIQTKCASEKAAQLQSLDLDNLPWTCDLLKQIDQTFEIVSKNKHQRAQKQAVRLLLEHQEILQEAQERTNRDYSQSSSCWDSLLEPMAMQSSIANTISSCPRTRLRNILHCALDLTDDIASDAPAENDAPCEEMPRRSSLPRDHPPLVSLQEAEDESESSMDDEYDEHHPIQEQPPVHPTATATSLPKSSLFLSPRKKLLQRIELHKQREQPLSNTLSRKLL